MKDIKAFLLFSSGAHQSILDRCPTDMNRYAAIGATVFFTGLLAFISASYALYSVFNSWAVAILLGVVWGVMIYNLDRLIVLSLRSTGSFFRDLLMAMPRIALALLFAIVISTPLELRIFNNEIEGELILMNEEQRNTQEEVVKARFLQERNDLLTTRSGLEAEINTVRKKRDELALAALQEADGTGGSMQKNLGPIYKAKKAAADKLTLELNEKIASSRPLLGEIENGLKTNLEEERKAIVALASVPISGLIGRLEALSRLTAKSPMIHTAHLFIFLLFVGLELTPILVKLLSLKSPYDMRLSTHEFDHETNNSVIRHLADSKMKEYILVHGALITHRTKATIEAEKAIIDQKLKEKLQEVKRGSGGWDTAMG